MVNADHATSAGRSVEPKNERKNTKNPRRSRKMEQNIYRAQRIRVSFVIECIVGVEQRIIYYLIHCRVLDVMRKAQFFVVDGAI